MIGHPVLYEDDDNEDIDISAIGENSVVISSIVQFDGICPENTVVSFAKYIRALIRYY